MYTIWYYAGSEGWKIFKRGVTERELWAQIVIARARFGATNMATYRCGKNEVDVRPRSRS